MVWLGLAALLLLSTVWSISSTLKRIDQKLDRMERMAKTACEAFDVEERSVRAWKDRLDRYSPLTAEEREAKDRAGRS